MPKINDLIAQKAAKGEDWVSYEYFPPRSEQGVKNLEARFERMKAARMPLFCDMTWGAGGSTSDLTMELTLKMKQLGLEPNMHLTCTNVERKDVVKALQTCKDNDVRNIVALRGDPPHGQEKWEATEGGFECALDLVKFIRREHGDYFCLSVAGYPEGHPDKILPVTGGYDSLSEAEKRRCSVQVADDGTDGAQHPHKGLVRRQRRARRVLGAHPRRAGLVAPRRRRAQLRRGLHRAKGVLSLIHI